MNFRIFLKQFYLKNQANNLLISATKKYNHYHKIVHGILTRPLSSSALDFQDLTRIPHAGPKMSVFIKIRIFGKRTHFH